MAKFPLRNYSPRAAEDYITRLHTPFAVPKTPPTVVSTLKNNMKVATEEGYGETATIGVFIDAGMVDCLIVWWFSNL